MSLKEETTEPKDPEKEKKKVSGLGTEVGDV